MTDDLSSFELSQLADSPAFIIVVIMAIFYLVLDRKEKGFFSGILKIAAWIYIGIYLLALYLYFF